MSTKHLKTIYVNVDESWITSDRKTKLVYQPSFKYNDHLKIRFIVQDSNSVVQDLTGYTFKLAVDYTYATSHTDLISCTDFDTTNADVGIIIANVNCKSASLLSYLGTSKSKAGYFNLWGYKSGEVNQLLFQSACTLSNVCGFVDVELESSSSSSSEEYSESSSSSSSSEGYSSESSSSMDDIKYLVDGIVTPDCTGEYIRSGTYNGEYTYSNGTYTIWFNTANFVIGTDVEITQWVNVAGTLLGNYYPIEPALGQATVSIV